MTSKNVVANSKNKASRPRGAIWVHVNKVMCFPLVDRLTVIDYRRLIYSIFSHPLYCLESNIPRLA